MANFGTWLQREVQKIPGTDWASHTSLGSAATGGLPAALSRNNWRFPVGSQTSSFDDLAGAGSSGSKMFRNAARGVGAAFGGGALYGAGAGGSAAGGGASEIGYGFPLAEEAGGSGPAGGSQLSGPTGGSSVMDWIRRAQQGSKLMNQGQGGMNGVRGQAPSSIFDAAPGLMGTDPNLYNANADDLKNKGRYGDDQLLHVSQDELAQLNSTGKLTQNPETGLPEAFSLGGMFGGGSGGGGGIGGLLGPIGNLVGANQNNQNLMGIANQASNASNPLAASQRQPYQGMLSNLMTTQGAQDFMQNDPSVQAQRRMIGDQMQSSFGKSGNMPLTGIMGSAQLANAFGGQYNQRIQDLGMLGGFNQGNPYGGMPYTALMGPRQDSNAMAMGGLGSLFGSLGGMFGGGGMATPLSQLNGMGNMSLTDPAYG